MDVNKDMVRLAINQVRELIEKALTLAISEGLLPEAEIPAFAVEIPADTSHGDFASNVAMAGARVFKSAPAKIAGIIVDKLDFTGTMFSRAETAGPGFLNFFLDSSWFSGVVESILTLGDKYGRTDYGEGKKVMVEFVSANPTGPMHMGNARGGALGDCLAAALDAAGYNVSREFYVNDTGSQIEKFGLSLEARYLQIFKGDEIVFPEDGYHGEDIKERAREYADKFGDKLVGADSETRRKELTDYALPLNIAALKRDLTAYRVEYDTWFHDSTLYADGTVEKVLNILRDKGLTYKKDGAEWYKATEFGGEKDEVLVKQNGFCTYLAPDIAYHYNKFALRGFWKVINIWGADHHGHVARLKGAIDAIGLSGDMLDIILMQMVRLIKDGEPYRMSKRTGKSVTLSDIIDEIPVDAARFFFNMRDPGSMMDFDLDLAVEQSSQNPVYYVQYAHARICSIMRKLAEEGINPADANIEDLSMLSQPEERELIRLLAKYPSEIINAAVKYDPAGLTHYALDVAAMFHKFYNAHKVMAEDERLMRARIALCTAVKTVISNVLSLMKISAPQRM